MRKISWLMILILVMGNCANAADTHGGAYALKYRFVRGDKSQYAMSFKVTAVIAGQPSHTDAPAMKGDGTVTLSVQRVEKDGSATISATLSHYHISGLGPTPSFRDRTATFWIGADGRLLRGSWPMAGVSSSVAGPLVNPDMFATAMAQLPAKPVKVGEKWVVKRDNINKGAPPMVITSTLQRVETKPAGKVAVVKQSFAIPIAAILNKQDGSGTLRMSGRLTIRGTALINMDKGQAISSTVDGGGRVRLSGDSSTVKGGPGTDIDMRIQSAMALKTTRSQPGAGLNPARK